MLQNELYFENLRELVERISFCRCEDSKNRLLSEIQDFQRRCLTKSITLFEAGHTSEAEDLVALARGTSYFSDVV